MSCFRADALSGQHIVISGGCGALGVPVIRALVEHGARMSVNDLLAESEAESRLSAAAIPAGSVRYFRGDIAEADTAERFVVYAREAFGPIHTALCHAGMVVPGSLVDFSEKDWDRTMSVNVKSAFLLARAAARTMIEDGIAGHLIFTTSWVSDVPWPDIGAYNASKAAMKQLMRSFARELAPRKIRANAVAPGIVGAGMARRQWDADAEYRARAQKAIPLGELQSPESVADAFLFLSSAAAAYMTGSVLLVDGGCSLYPMD